MRACSRGDTARSLVVTSTVVGTSQCLIQRRESKVATATPASVTMRQSWRRISSDAQRWKVLGRSPVGANGMRLRIVFGSPQVTRSGPAIAETAPTTTICWRRPGTSQLPVAASTRPETSSGWRFHNSWAIGPPIEYPTAITGPQPRCSISAAVSSAQSAKRNRRRERMPRPWPRISGTMMLKCFDSSSNAL